MSTNSVPDGMARAECQNAACRRVFTYRPERGGNPRRYCSSPCKNRAARFRETARDRIGGKCCTKCGRQVANLRAHGGLCEPCATGLAEVRLVVSTEQRALSDPLALDPCCTCGAAYQPMCEYGVTFDWCPGCGKTVPIPTRGVRTHDQRERLEAWLDDRVATESNPKPQSSAGKRDSSIQVGRRITDHLNNRVA